MNLFKDDQNRNPLDYYGLRQAAIKQELMPSYRNITKPTRDIQASNRSHSLSKDDLNGSYNNRILTSQKKIMMLQKQLEQCEFQREANIVYNRQFRQIGRVLGNQNMQFDQIKQKIQDLILQAPEIQHHHHQVQNIQTYQTKILKQQIEALQRQLQIKNNSLSELGQKKRYSEQKQSHGFNSNFRSFKDHPEYKEYMEKISNLQHQVKQLRSKNNQKSSSYFSQTYKIQEEVLRLKKEQELYLFKIQGLQNKIQSLNSQLKLLKNKQSSISASETESKLLYKGVYISASTLLKQLSHRDEQKANQNYHLIEIQQKLQTQLKKSAQRDISQDMNNNNLKLAQQKIFYLEEGKNRSQNQIRSLKYEIQSNKIQLKSYQERVSEYQKRIDVLNLKNIELQQRKSKESSTEFQLNQLKRKVKEEQGEIVKLGQYIQKINTQNDQLKINSQKGQLQRQKLQKQYKQLSEINTSLTISFQKLSTQCSNTKRQYEQLHQKYQQSCSTVTSLQKKYTSIKQIYEQICQKYSNSTNQYSQNIKKISNSNNSKNQNIIKQYVTTIQSLELEVNALTQDKGHLETQVQGLRHSLEQLSKKYNTHVNSNSKIHPMKSMQKIQNNISNVESQAQSLINTKQYYQYEYFNKYSQQNQNMQGTSTIRNSQYQTGNQKFANNKSGSVFLRQYDTDQKGSQVQFRHSSNKNQYQQLIISLQERIRHLQFQLEKYSQSETSEIKRQNLNLKAKIATMQDEIDQLHSKMASRNQASSVNKYSGSFGRVNNQKTNGVQIHGQSIKSSNIQINLNSSSESKRQKKQNIHYANVLIFLQQFQADIKSSNTNFNEFYQTFKSKLLSYITTIESKLNIQINYEKRKYLQDYQAEQVSKLTKKSCVQEEKHCNDNLSGSDLKFQRKEQIIKQNKISNTNQKQISNINQSRNQDKKNYSQSDAKSNSNDQSHGQLSRKILNQNGSKQSQSQSSKISEKGQGKRQSHSKIQRPQLQSKLQNPSYSSSIEQKIVIVNNFGGKDIHTNQHQTKRQENIKSIHEKIKDLMEAQKQESHPSKIQSNILPQYSNKAKKQATNNQILVNNNISHLTMKDIQNGVRPLSTILSNNSVISHSSGLRINHTAHKQNNRQSSISHEKRQSSSKSINNRPASRISINYGNTSKVIYTNRSPFLNNILPISPIKSDSQSMISRPSYVVPIYAQVKKQQSRRSSINGEDNRQIEQNSFSKQLNRQNSMRMRQNYQVGYQQGLPIYSSKELIGKRQSNSNNNIIFNQLKSSRVSESKRIQTKSPQNSVIQKLKRETIVSDEYYPIVDQQNKLEKAYRDTNGFNHTNKLIHPHQLNSNIYSTVSSTGRFVQNRPNQIFDSYRGARTSQNNQNRISSPRGNNQRIFMHKNLVSSNISEKIDNKNSAIWQQNNVPPNQSFASSQDSGIDVLQYDKGFNCCKD